MLNPELCNKTEKQKVLQQPDKVTATARTFNTWLRFNTPTAPHLHPCPLSTTCHV